MSDIQTKIAGYMKDKAGPSASDMLAFIGMIESGEAVYEDFVAVGGVVLSMSVARRKRKMDESRGGAIMSKTKAEHTPGPWGRGFVEHNAGGYTVEVDGGEPLGTIAVVECYEGNEANLDLMLSAPNLLRQRDELLEALKSLCDRADRARAILRKPIPSQFNNWGMLDTSCERTAIINAERKHA